MSCTRHPGSAVGNARPTLVCAASIWLVACILLITPREAAAQQFTTRQYQQIAGVGNLSVTCLLQDRAGFIWMCTESGLFRHDGVGFERFWKSEGIDSLDIRSAVEDSSGGEIPIVIINGMAKANPTVDEVAAELRRGK
jgi:ligand-binding sensor domain-containing protein